MDFKELELLTIPQDFTGIRLLEVTKEIISQWPLFQLALEYNTYKFGNLGSQAQVDKITHLICALTINFTIKDQDLQEFLCEYLETYYDIIADDNSEVFVANKIMTLFNNLELGKLETYNQIKNEIQEFKKTNLPPTHQYQNQIQDDSSSDDELEEPKQQLQQQEQQQLQHQPTSLKIQEEKVDNVDNDIDDDGFETVVDKKKFIKK